MFKLGYLVKHNTTVHHSHPLGRVPSYYGGTLATADFFATGRHAASIQASPLEAISSTWGVRNIADLTDDTSRESHDALSFKLCYGRRGPGGLEVA
ncbi:hypothetical protein VMCG_04668 [Cytospora schulzeri]|uniref:Uncharacterized protein n=1 Tax=Cytospora schulzeri TaxID=448051 RepID=A0A423WRW6_9PEZI|nr:hypothetical protein VMCG_04668 [Valsa malicola]